MVALVLFALVGVALLIYLSGSKKNWKLEDTKLSLLKSSKQLEQVIEKDLSTSLRNDGYTSSTMAGLRRDPDSVRANPTDNDGLILVQEKYGEFSLPVDVPLLGDTGFGKFDFNVPGQSDPVYDFFDSAVNNKSLFAISNVEGSTIVVRNGSPTIQSGKEFVPFETDGFQNTNFQGMSNSLRAVEVVRYFKDPNGPN